MIIFLQNDKNAFCDPGLNIYLVIAQKRKQSSSLVSAMYWKNLTWNYDALSWLFEAIT